MRLRKTIKTAGLAVLLAALAATAPLAQTGGFRFYGPLARVITPNGDRRNDVAFFCFENPSDSEVAGRIYTLLGAEVASMSPRAPSAGTSCPQGASLLSQNVAWDGFTRGTPARSGLYVYRISAEGRTYSGTLLVVR